MGRCKAPWIISGPLRGAAGSSVPLPLLLGPRWPALQPDLWAWNGPAPGAREPGHRQSQPRPLWGSSLGDLESVLQCCPSRDTAAWCLQTPGSWLCLLLAASLWPVTLRVHASVLAYWEDSPSPGMTKLRKRGPGYPGLSPSKRITVPPFPVVLHF